MFGNQSDSRYAVIAYSSYRGKLVCNFVVIRDEGCTCKVSDPVAERMGYSILKGKQL